VTHEEQGPGPAGTNIAEISRWLASAIEAGERCVLGVTGAPGAGKSTFAQDVADRMAGAPIVGMDGFHLANDHLVGVDLIHRKGAHYTFDAWGFVSLVRRISEQGADEVVYAPVFDRSIEDSIGSALPIALGDRLVIVEGNYLLLELPPWNEIRGLLTKCIYLDLDEELRLKRLIDRHIEFGKTPKHARRHVAESDQVNARLVAESRHRADWFVRMQ